MNWEKKALLKNAFFDLIVTGKPQQENAILCRISAQSRASQGGVAPFPSSLLPSSTFVQGKQCKSLAQRRGPQGDMRNPIAKHPGFSEPVPTALGRWGVDFHRKCIHSAWAACQACLAHYQICTTNISLSAFYAAQSTPGWAWKLNCTFTSKSVVPVSAEGERLPGHWVISDEHSPPHVPESRIEKMDLGCLTDDWEHWDQKLSARRPPLTLAHKILRGTRG